MELTISGATQTGLRPMVDASSDTTSNDLTEPVEHLDGGVVLFWFVIGSALMATAIVAFGWRWTVAIWVGSGLLLGLLGACERVWHRHKQ